MRLESGAVVAARLAELSKELRVRVIPHCHSRLTLSDQPRINVCPDSRTCMMSWQHCEMHVGLSSMCMVKMQYTFQDKLTAHL